MWILSLFTRHLVNSFNLEIHILQSYNIYMFYFFDNIFYSILSIFSPWNSSRLNFERFLDFLFILGDFLNFIFQSLFWLLKIYYHKFLRVLSYFWFTPFLFFVASNSCFMVAIFSLISLIINLILSLHYNLYGTFALCIVSFLWDYSP